MRGSKNYQILLWLVLVLFNYEIHAEKNVTRHAREFHCIDGTYIFARYFCDGLADCKDGSDEMYGCNQKCGIGNFTCESSSECLPVAVRCNGIKECSDGSDEKFCDHEPSFVNCTIKKGKFLCADKKRCVDLNRVCDGSTHCFDGSDEAGKCDDYDPKVCNVCSHPCFHTPEGPLCFRHPDDKNYDYREYPDLRTCDPANNHCDQKCNVLRDVMQCSCEENFIPRYVTSMSFQCEEKEKNKNMLLYAVNGAIRGIPGYDNRSVLLTQFEGKITAIAAANMQVYWAGERDRYKLIAKAPFSRGPTEVISDEGVGELKEAPDVITDQGIGEVNAMDVDWRTGNVYFIDNVNKRIAACSDKSKRCIEIFSLKRNATSITLAPRFGFMFWSMQDDVYGYVIMKSEMSGQYSYNFVRDGLGDIYSISADEASERLYWLDSSRRKIEMIWFNGKGRTSFHSDLRINYQSIAVNARYLYWTQINSSSIYYFKRVIYHRTPEAAFNSTEPIRLIYGYSHSEKQTEMEPPCSWGCKNGICLMESSFNKTSSKCICSNTTQILNNNWCLNDSISIYERARQTGYHVYDFRPAVFESPHGTFRIIVIIFSLVILVCAVAYYLYKKGYLQNFRFR